MKLYLKDLLRRLSQFSEKLDKTALFIEKKWVLIDEDKNHHTYIFERNGNLIMSINGMVQEGKWKYLQPANSILINRTTDKILLNQAFFDRAVMILKYDGSSNNYFVLADEGIIPDLDVETYLQSLFYEKNNILAGEIMNGKTLEIHRPFSNAQLQIGMKATINGEVPIDGEYTSKGTGKCYELKNGRILKITRTSVYSCEDGEKITVKQNNTDRISKNDFAFINNSPAPTGKYKLKSGGKLKIVDGVVRKYS